MHAMKYSLIGLLATAIYAQAGGAASVVAQKSKTKGFSYSYETEMIFMNECTQGANQRVCRCVFGKIKQQYSETDYWRLENDLRRNVDHPEYISYLTESVEQCDAEYAEGSYGGSGDGLAGLLGGGGGGIATKAKGSIRTSSERDIEIGAGSSRSAADIMKVVRQRTPGLRHVYNKFLKKKPGFQGKVALKFTIDPSGVIISISIAASTTGYSEFDNEIKSAVSRWKFNKVNAGNTTITIPFTFSE
ncbi:AgmX/PglI C-terminal domain-containing protein [uncultured Fibrobacter sp.]|uniref:AgmX/PglI C-terminal domain-containing protein n=1 Tax=uncultured Fibrobacter sp. TaxID=261512 RepID=UPI0025E82115|nr:AgmX/PglI C-terminal domain-containing protein [uncultured Fibrobacter sp.]